MICINCSLVICTLIIALAVVAVILIDRCFRLKTRREELQNRVDLETMRSGSRNEFMEISKNLLETNKKIVEIHFDKTKNADVKP